MRSKYFFLAFLFLLVNTGNIICSQNLVYSGSNGTILFKSDAPLELISAKSDELKGALKLSDGTFAFTIDNRSFKGFNSPLQQEHFYENYIEADKFPSSTFVGKIIEPIDPQGKGEYAVRAKGILNIHGVDQERIINSRLELKGEELLIRATFTIFLRDHDIEIPRVVNQKIADEIYITVELPLHIKEDQK